MLVYVQSEKEEKEEESVGVRVRESGATALPSSGKTVRKIKARRVRANKVRSVL